MFKYKNIVKLMVVNIVAILIIFSSISIVFALDKEIIVLSINDFHGSLASSGKNVGAAKLAYALKAEKAKKPESTIIVSAGDNYQGSAISNLLYGEPVSAVFKEISIQLSAVGNHEFDWGIERITKWSNDGGFPFVCSNIYDKRTNQPVEWAVPYLIIERAGVQVGFIGLATPETAYKTLKANVENYEFRDPVAALNEWLPEVKSAGANVIIALTHLGSSQDETGKISGEAIDLFKVEGIDAVISAHTHKSVSGLINNKPIVQAYYNGRTIAKLTFVFDENNNLLSAVPSLDHLYQRSDTLKDDPNTLAIYNQYEQDLQPILGRVLGKTKVELDHDRYTEPSLLGEWTCEIMREKVGVQIAMTNGGGLRTAIPAGEITAGKLYEVMPFDNTLYTMKLSGTDLKSNIEHGIMNDDVGWIQISGVFVNYNRNAEAGNRIISMTLEDGTPVEMDQYYTVVTNDFMATGGDNYNFTNALETMDTYIPIRDAMMESMEKTGTISPIRRNWIFEEVIGTNYVVVPGDSVWKIAKKYGTTMEEIIQLNKLTNPRIILPGQKLKIPIQ